MKKVLIASVAVLVLVGFTRPASAQGAEKGAKVYAEKSCQMCHSIAGKGNIKGPLDGVGSKLTPDEIREWLTDPAAAAAKAKADRKPPMSTIAAKLKTLSKGEVDDLVAYISSLKKK